MKKIYVKNMVCPRCIQTVKVVFEKLNLNIHSIQLGEVIVDSQDIDIDVLKEKLEAHGFELLEDKSAQTISQIKSLIIESIFETKEKLRSNYSDYLSKSLGQNYATLSRLFSSTEGITIEKFILKQKVERVKELIVYDEFSLSEIAIQLQYSSVAHLSSQFKKETGMTPSEFRRLNPGRQYIDSI